jgi:hypothetical protein
MQEREYIYYGEDKRDATIDSKIYRPYYRIAHYVLVNEKGKRNKKPTEADIFLNTHTFKEVEAVVHAKRYMKEVLVAYGNYLELMRGNRYIGDSQLYWANIKGIYAYCIGKSEDKHYPFGVKNDTQMAEWLKQFRVDNVGKAAFFCLRELHKTWVAEHKRSAIMGDFLNNELWTKATENFLPYEMLDAGHMYRFSGYVKPIFSMFGMTVTKDYFENFVRDYRNNHRNDVIRLLVEQEVVKCYSNDEDLSVLSNCMCYAIENDRCYEARIKPALLAVGWRRGQFDIA